MSDQDNPGGSGPPLGGTGPEQQAMEDGVNGAMKAVLRSLEEGRASAVEEKIAHRAIRPVPHGVETELTTERLCHDGERQVIRSYGRHLEFGDYSLHINWVPFGKQGPMLAINSVQKGVREGDFCRVRKQLTMVMADGSIQRLPEVEAQVPLNNPSQGMSMEETVSGIPELAADMFKHVYESGADSLEDGIRKAQEFLKDRLSKR